MALTLKCSCLFLCGIVLGSAVAQVMELDERFLDQRGDRPWLLEFYAPWCGHCKRLEPIYHQVSVALRDTNIKVAKLDATKFTNIAVQYEVKGYPTIKFVQGDNVYTHKGDRSKEGIVEFARRALGPQVRRISNVGKFMEIKGQHADGVFFVYIGPQDGLGDLMTKYAAIAEKYAVLGYFYSGEKNILAPEVLSTVKHDPTVVCFKDGNHFEYPFPADGIPTKMSLDNWVNGERYTAFPRVTAGGLNEMVGLSKKILIVITDETDKKHKQKMERFKEMAHLLATKHREKYLNDFQFVWMPDSYSADALLMSKAEVPSFLVLDPDTQYYYLPESGDQSEFTFHDLAKFLNQIQDGRLAPYGGSGIIHNLRRIWYDLYMSVYSVYETSGWLAVMIFGVPVLVIGIVCYALCCMEPFDENDWEEIAREIREQKLRDMMETDKDSKKTDEGSETKPRRKDANPERAEKLAKEYGHPWPLPELSDEEYEDDDELTETSTVPAVDQSHIKKE